MLQLQGLLQSAGVGGADTFPAWNLKQADHQKNLQQNKQSRLMLHMFRNGGQERWEPTWSKLCVLAHVAAGAVGSQPLDEDRRKDHPQGLAKKLFCCTCIIMILSEKL